MPKDIASLHMADERLDHQIVNTFAHVGTTDLNWTEKLWSAVTRVDGSLGVSFGVGKYTNRNVIDAFAGISRGREQWTIRASRELSTAAEEISVGPIRYEIIEPLARVRLVLEPNDVLPLSFDIEFQRRLPAFFEDRDVQFEHFRKTSDVIRYHQAGTASGSIELDGENIRVDENAWFGSRDHSWGVRELIGIPPVDLQPSKAAFGSSFQFNWFTSQLQRPDGSWYELHYHLRRSDAGVIHFTGYINDETGVQRAVRELVPDYRYASSTRAFLGGEARLRLVNGDERVIVIEPVGDSGFHLHAGGYWAWAGGVFGSWRGPLHVEGEYLANCDKMPAEASSELGWQVRDRPVRVTEGDATGYGILESICYGDWPGIEADTEES